MYKYCESNDEHISLHDCHATNIQFENGVVKFFFEDGIWISSEYGGNQLGKTVRTDKAMVAFSLEYGDEIDMCLYVFEKKFGMTICDEWPLSKLMEGINSKKYTLEFIYQYKGYHSVVMDCWLCSDKKPYHRDCQLKARVTKVEYYWNNLCEDKEW